MIKQKTTIAALLLLLAAAAARPALADPHTFTSPDGRQLTGEIQYGTKDTVTIKLDSGKDITAPIAKFSEDDQKYIREWIKTEAPKVNYGFSIKYEKKRISKKDRNTASHKIKDERWVYDVELENRSGIPLDDLELRYRIYVSSEHTGRKNTKAIVKADGMLEIPSIKHNARVNRQAGPVQLLTSDLDGDYVYTDGGRDRLSDELAGLWVKVFFKGKNVWEFKSPHKAVKDDAFSDEEALRAADQG